MSKMTWTDQANNRVIQRETSERAVIRITEGYVTLSHPGQDRVAGRLLPKFAGAVA